MSLLWLLSCGVLGGDEVEPMGAPSEPSPAAAPEPIEPEPQAPSVPPDLASATGAVMVAETEALFWTPSGVHRWRQGVPREPLWSSRGALQVHKIGGGWFVLVDDEGVHRLDPDGAVHRLLPRSAPGELVLSWRGALLYYGVEGRIELRDGELVGQPHEVFPSSCLHDDVEAELSDDGLQVRRNGERVVVAPLTLSNGSVGCLADRWFVVGHRAEAIELWHVFPDGAMQRVTEIDALGADAHGPYLAVVGSSQSEPGVSHFNPYEADPLSGAPVKGFATDRGPFDGATWLHPRRERSVGEALLKRLGPEP